MLDFIGDLFGAGEREAPRRPSRRAQEEAVEMALRAGLAPWLAEFKAMKAENEALKAENARLWNMLGLREEKCQQTKA
ncbi:hypothetical protein [Comamonas serinivorans]|uniref:hypothetical protein n=1 Tax=Comamonas serinivorans TaxID=1082851 RepID=UPI0012FA6F23|nr:hypothetical protein [Comamonas serinivorans]